MLKWTESEPFGAKNQEARQMATVRQIEANIWKGET